MGVLHIAVHAALIVTENGHRKTRTNTMQNKETTENAEKKPGIQLNVSLWDHYYGLAMQGLISCLSTKFACSRLSEEMDTNNHPANRTEWTIAKCAADYADAMIAEKRKREQA